MLPVFKIMIPHDFETTPFLEANLGDCCFLSTLMGVDNIDMRRGTEVNELLMHH